MLHASAGVNQIHHVRTACTLTLYKRCHQCQNKQQKDHDLQIHQQIVQKLFPERFRLFIIKSFFHNRFEDTGVSVPFGTSRYKITTTGTASKNASGHKLSNIIIHPQIFLRQTKVLNLLKSAHVSLFGITEYIGASGSRCTFFSRTESFCSSCS